MLRLIVLNCDLDFVFSFS